MGGPKCVNDGEQEKAGCKGIEACAADIQKSGAHGKGFRFRNSLLSCMAGADHPTQKSAHTECSSYNIGMDRERFGRVLGRGARMAARTAFEAVDAATSPSPNPPAAAAPRQPEVIPPRPAARPVAQPVSRPVAAVSPNLSRAVASATAGVAAPLKRASRALWYELTGSFFALFAVSFGGAMWKTRSNAVSAIPDDRHRFYAFCVLTLLFGYFSISSFLRARRR